MARWNRSGRRRVGDFRVFQIDEHQLERVGTDVRRTIHTIETVDWCNIVPVTREGSIVLVRQQRFGIDAQSIEIPGGLVDPGEVPIVAARRELAEETGYETAAPLVPLGVVHANPALQPTRLHMFLARDCVASEQGQQLEDMEDCEVLVVGRRELDRMLRAGEIGHALVWTALHAFELFERSEREGA